LTDDNHIVISPGELEAFSVIASDNQKQLTGIFRMNRIFRVRNQYKTG